MKKILIFGFPHSGTSILKSIIGHIDSVYELIDEVRQISSKDLIFAEAAGKSAVVCKWPQSLKVFTSDVYKDYYKIFVIRNPIYIFSSLNKRFKIRGLEQLPSGMPTLQDYESVAKSFKFYMDNPLENLFTIKYEDFFSENYFCIRNILDKIGLEYTSDIFNNTEYRNSINSDTSIQNLKPENHNHKAYRTWQINQPFTNNNLPEKIDLLQHQIDFFKNSDDIQKLYLMHRKVYLSDETL